MHPEISTPQWRLPDAFAVTIRLRPHHLLCMLTFVGKGYTPAFTENYTRLAARLSAGEDIVIVDGPDDICAPLLSDPTAHCRLESVVGRDGRAAEVVAGNLGHPVVPGRRIVPDAAMLDAMRTAFRQEPGRAACDGCEWHDLCTSVAANDFDGVLVKAGDSVPTWEEPVSDRRETTPETLSPPRP